MEKRLEFHLVARKSVGEAVEAARRLSDFSPEPPSGSEGYSVLVPNRAEKPRETVRSDWDQNRR